ncbi:hypothetical protein AS006_08790 [Thermotoga sp. SG1]|nr:hypothetical protein AS006_08790 [Thermotoga sp. SG1]
MAGIFFKFPFFRDTFLGTSLVFLVSFFENNSLWFIPLVLIILASKFGVSISFSIIGILSYSFIFSTMLLSGFAMILVRSISDFLYLKDSRKIYENYSGAIVFVIMLSFMVGNVLFRAYQYKTLAVWLFVSFSVLQTVLLFVGAIEKTHALVLPVLFIFSSLIILFKIFGNIINEKYLLVIISFSMGFLTFIANSIITKHLRISTHLKFDFLHYARKYPELLLIAFFYYFSYWIDNIIMWFKKGLEVAPNIIISPNYDFPLFIAAISFTPAIVLFSLGIETTFLKKYLSFFSAIKNNKTLEQIEARLEEIQASMKHILLETTLVAITIAILDLSASKFLNKWLSKFSITVFRLGAIGHLFNVIFMLMLTIHLYFNFYKEAFIGVLISFSVNLILTAFCRSMAPGLGFLLAFFSGSVFLLRKMNLKDLVFKIYSSQQHGLEKVERISWRP